MPDFSTTPTLVRTDAGANFGADNFGKDVHHTKVHTPGAFELIARVQGFGGLPNDWDGHGASALPHDIIELAFDALTQFDVKGCLPTKVMPGVGNDIAMLWERNNYRALLEISLDGWDWSIEYHSEDKPDEYFEAVDDVNTCAEQVRMSMLNAEA